MAYRQALLASEIQRAIEIQIIGLRAVENELMGITEVRQRLHSTPGAEALSMKYGPHGVQIFNFNGRSVTMPPMATDDEILKALTTAPTQQSDDRRIIRMGKLQEVAQRIAKTKQSLDAEADKLSSRLDDLDKKAPEAFQHSHAILDQQNADLDGMESEIRQLSNLPLGQ